MNNTSMSFRVLLVVSAFLWALALIGCGGAAGEPDIQPDTMQPQNNPDASPVAPDAQVRPDAQPDTGAGGSGGSAGSGGTGGQAGADAGSSGSGGSGGGSAGSGGTGGQGGADAGGAGTGGSAGSADAGTPDATPCDQGSSCPPDDTCHTAAIDCSSGGPVCNQTSVPNGTACGTNLTCSNGACVCHAGAPCELNDPVNHPCVYGEIDCSTGAPACQSVLRPALKPDGTACSAYPGHFCYANYSGNIPDSSCACGGRGQNCCPGRTCNSAADRCYGDPSSGPGGCAPR